MKSLTLLAALFVLSAAIAFPYPSMAADPETLAIGSKAPDFTLPGVDGKDHSLKDYADAKVLAVIFTCNHCPTAQAYEPRIKQLAEDYKDKGVAVVAISPNDPKAVRLDELGYTDVNDSLEDMKLRAEHKNFNFPYLYDGDKQEVSKKYGPKATPHVFVFDADRVLRYTGAIDDNEKQGKAENHFVRNAIDAILSGGEVDPQTTKTFGCSVKWSDKRDSVREAFERWAKEDVSVEPIDAEGIKKLVKNDSGKLRLFNVWATWCGPCVAEFPELVTINRMYRHRDFEMITISADDIEAMDGVESFLKKNEASMTNYLYNGGNKIAMIEAVDMEASGAIPLTILVKPGGEIIYRHEGMIDPLEVKREIVNVLGNTY